MLLVNRTTFVSRLPKRLLQTVKIATRYGFSFWDSMIVASALNNHCSVLYSEDLQHNQLIDGRLQII